MLRPRSGERDEARLLPFGARSLTGREATQSLPARVDFSRLPTYYWGCPPLRDPGHARAQQFPMPVGLQGTALPEWHGRVFAAEVFFSAYVFAFHLKPRYPREFGISVFDNAE